ncbi:transmembrane protein 192-like [Convolutriloba macropyga]|uniref:transmembrane protein 192-like n=1 Tax=Convolutriloba macropyga TaxID=536237 RepID=UPI003F51DDD6
MSSGEWGSFREQLVRRELSVAAHKSITSLPLNILQLLLFCGNVVLAFLYAHFYTKETDEIQKSFGNPFSVISYYNVFNWICLLLIHKRLKQLHRRSLAEGYFAFYRKTKEIRGAPFLLSSFMNTVLLVMVNLLRDLQENSNDNSDKTNNESDYTLDILQGLTCLELLLATVFIAKYAWLVRKFNRSRDPPDYMLETNKFIDQPGDNLTGRDNAVVEIGFREVSRSAEIIERQYDIIVHLSRKLRETAAERYDNAVNRNRSILNGDVTPGLNGDQLGFSGSGIDP